MPESELRDELARVDGYSRDRSFYESRPNGVPTKVHRESSTAPEMAACDTTWILLNMDMVWDVVRLQSEQSSLLCRRCWPDADMSNPPASPKEEASDG